MLSDKSQLAFFTLCLTAVLIVRHAVLATFSVAWRDEQYTHILLVLPFVLAMAWLQSHSQRTQLGFQASGLIILGLAVVLAGATIWIMPHVSADVKLALSMTALALWCIGAFVACFGNELAYKRIFPLCFLFWLVPFPQFVLDGVVSALQQGSAFSAKLLFQVVGVPVAQDGVRLMIPGLTLEVASECSSIRSSMILLITTMAVAQIVLRSGWRKLLLVLVAIPLSVGKNGLRIFTIAMLATRVDPAYLNGRLHREGGPIFLGIALVVIFLLLWILRRTEQSSSNGSFVRTAIRA